MSDLNSKVQENNIFEYLKQVDDKLFIHAILVNHQPIYNNQLVNKILLIAKARDLMARVYVATHALPIPLSRISSRISNRAYAIEEVDYEVFGDENVIAVFRMKELRLSEE